MHLKVMIIPFPRIKEMSDRSSVAGAVFSKIRGLSMVS